MKVSERIIDRSSWDEINIEGWCKALIPPTWEVDDEGEIIVFDPDGFGELNFNFLEKSNDKSKKETATEIIESWAEELGQEYNYEMNIIKRSKNLLIVSADFVSNEPEGEVEFWRIFAVVGNEIALDVNYNCEVEDRDREERIIEGIVDSIQIIDKPNFSAAIDQTEETEL